MQITVERVKHNGHLILSTVSHGQYIKHVYIGYSEREARRLFRVHVRDCLVRNVIIG